MHARQILGQQGEDLAATHLARQGLQVLHRNWRPVGSGIRGELDIIARDGAVLAVCEVKTRRSWAQGSPVEAVAWDKRRRLRRLTALFLQANPHLGPVRGDVIAIDVASDIADPRTVLRHLKGVW